MSRTYRWTFSVTADFAPEGYDEYFPAIQVNDFSVFAETRIEAITAVKEALDLGDDTDPMINLYQVEEI